MTQSAYILTPLRYPTFRRIWSANVASNLGGLIQSVGAAWLMTSLTNSVDMVALVQASSTLPIMMFSLLGGVVADSFSRRRVMIAAQLFTLVASLALAAGTQLGFMSPWLLLALTFLIGSGVALKAPAYQATAGDLVPREQLASAVALNSIGINLSRSLGPALGGLIVAAAGVVAAFVVNAASYLALILVLARWKPAAADSSLPRETLGPAMLAGLRYAALSPNIWKVLLRAFIFGFTSIAVVSLLPVVAMRLLGAGPTTYGLMLGAFGAGSVAGAVASEWLYQRLRAEHVVRLAFLGVGACAAGVAISSSAWLTGAALLIGGLSWVMAFSLCNLSVQLASSRWVVGRIVSIYQMAAFGGMALGSWAWGSIAEAHGLLIALVLAAGTALAGGALGLRIPLPERSTLDLAPVDNGQAPRAFLDAAGNSGPVVVHISYKVAPANLPAFLAVMDDLRRIRLRDGARRWMLLRDAADADLWVECYSTPTWLDYLRHNTRVTRADSAVSARIAALHEGPEPPEVRCLLERPTGWAGARTKQATIDVQ